MPLTQRKVPSVPSTMLEKNKKEKLIICFENRRFLKSYCNELLLTDLASKFELTFLIHKHLTGFETEHMEKFGKIVIFQENIGNTGARIRGLRRKELHGFITVFVI